ncbi:MAG: calcium-binding protein [Elainella sp. C42_A2020_010]|nr:calcium-binding protein [Elainella sp. C42_A2020_010]
MAKIRGTNGNDTLQGGAENDSIVGLGGNDFLSGGAGNDTIRGDSGDDTLIGEAGDDTLIGGDGSDLLSGREGNDRMTGGRGDDRYVVDAIGDVVQEAAGEGVDTVISFIESYALTANVENLILVGNSFRGFGNDLNNEIRGNNNNNTLFGGAGNDVLIGFDGDDFLSGDAGNDILTGGAGKDTFRYRLDVISTSNGSDVDLITDFLSGTDKIVLGGIAPASFSEAQVTIVADDAAAATSEAQLIYSKASGSVFFNENRGAAGFGTGGEFVKVQGSVLTSNDFSILPEGAVASPAR